MKKIVVVFCIEDFSFTIYPAEYWTEELIPSYREALVNTGYEQEEVDTWSDDRVVSVLWEDQFVFEKCYLENTDVMAYDVADGSLMTFKEADWNNFISDIGKQLSEESLVEDLYALNELSVDEALEMYYGTEFIWEKVEK